MVNIVLKSSKSASMDIYWGFCFKNEEWLMTKSQKSAFNRKIKPIIICGYVAPNRYYERERKPSLWRIGCLLWPGQNWLHWVKCVFFSFGAFLFSYNFPSEPINSTMVFGTLSYWLRKYNQSLFIPEIYVNVFMWFGIATSSSIDDAVSFTLIKRFVLLSVHFLIHLKCFHLNLLIYSRCCFFVLFISINRYFSTKL